MIVLDEHLGVASVFRPLALRYRGNVSYVQDLRRGTIIKDDAIPALLLRRKNSIFLTANASDFWLKIKAHPSYCVVCFPLPPRRYKEIPELLWQLLRHASFRTARQRMGKVIRVTSHGIQCYRSAGSLQSIPWLELRT